MEAMTLDTPIVSSAQTGGPRGRRRAGRFGRRRRRGEAWAAAVAQALGRREQLVAAGRARRRQFTLEASGSALATAYRQAAARMRVIVLCPHFEPDTAPTGVVMSRIVHELASRGHELHVVTSLPWYRAHRIEPEWSGRSMTTEATRMGLGHPRRPVPGARQVEHRPARRSGSPASRRWPAWLVSAPAGSCTEPMPCWRCHRHSRSGSPGGWSASSGGAPLVFNVQDIFPDAAVRTGAIRNRRVIALAAWLERLTYRRAAAVTVLSDDLRRNVAAKTSDGAPRHACT